MLKADETAQYAARMTMSLSMPLTSVEQINITNITDATVTRCQLYLEQYQYIQRSVVTFNGTYVDFVVVVELEQIGYTSSDAELAYDSLTTQITESFASGTLQNNLKTAGLTMGVQIFETVEIEDLPQIEEMAIAYLITTSPTVSPTVSPTASPTRTPTAGPTVAPTTFTPRPTVAIRAPTSSHPTPTPTGDQIGLPSKNPTSIPSNVPTVIASNVPSGQPTSLPSSQPSCVLSGQPTSTYTATSILPTSMPHSNLPTTMPTAAPSSFIWRSCTDGTEAYISSADSTDDSVHRFPYTIGAYPDILVAVLPNSSDTVLLTLVWIDARYCSKTSLARSYSGYDWESSIPLLLLTPPHSGV